MTTTLDAPVPGTARVTSSGTPTAGRTSLARLTALELRKSVDTRSGRWLLLVVLGLGLAGLGWRLWNAENTPVAFESFIGTAMVGVQLVLPVIGIMAMTSEWTQRTALTTFTLTPRRGRVLTAKTVSAVLLGAAVTLAVLAVGALATLAGGAVTGTEASWVGAGDLVLGALLANSLNVLMAVGFGALIPLTAAAVTAFLVAPNLWSLAGPSLFQDAAQYLDVYSTFGRFLNLDFSQVPQTVTSLSVWIVLPLALGIAASLRREIS